jgi:hypothetical protein
VEQIKNGATEPTAAQLSVVVALDAAARTEPVSWVSEFLDCGGLEALCTSMYAIGIRNTLSSTDCEVLYASARCIKSIVNTQPGLQTMLRSESAILQLTQSYPPWDNGDHNIFNTKKGILELLSIFCALPGGHTKVLQAFDLYRLTRKEPYRFFTLLRDMSGYSIEFQVLA